MAGHSIYAIWSLLLSNLGPLQLVFKKIAQFDEFLDAQQIQTE